MDLNKLKEPFAENEIEWRIGSCGKKQNGETWAMCLAYITSRALHDRFDNVCGVENWQLEYKAHNITASFYDNETKQNKSFDASGTIARIGVKFNNEWIWKEGGAPATHVESFKGSLSDAEKRAGVPWGVGRYLYDLKDCYADCKNQKETGYTWAKGFDKETKQHFVFYWKPPKLPAWALPKIEKIQTFTEKYENLCGNLFPDFVKYIKQEYNEGKPFKASTLEKFLKDNENYLFDNCKDNESLNKFLAGDGIPF